MKNAQSQMLNDKCSSLPDAPGIYMFRNKQGEVIYVGKAISLKKRVSSYFRKSARHDPKTAKMTTTINDIDFIPLKSDVEALILEYRFIKEFKPRYNILMKDDKQYPLLKFTHDLFPCMKVVRNQLPDGATYLGPFTEAKALKKAKREIEKIFGIRPCSVNVPTKKHAKHCLYHQTGQCTSPCLGRISTNEYEERVKEAVLVMTGQSKRLIYWLEKRMKRLSKELKYEEAAQLRDVLSAVKNISGSRIKSILKFKRPVQDYDEEIKVLQELLELKIPPKIIEAFDVSNITGQFATGSMVHFYEGRPDKRFYKNFRIRKVTGIDDYAMMAEIVTRHFNRLLDEKKALPDLVVIDGGKGHLETALKVFKSLGLSHIPAIGLAKRNEEIFIPGLSDPVILEKDMPVLQLFQRIRDEAHRFAISYHRKLRSKKIKDSILYKIPGLGEKKLKLLLKHFGSVKRISNSSIEEITAVPGFGRKSAQTILDFLKSSS